MSLDDVSLHLIDSLDDVNDFRLWLGERRPVDALAIDSETTGLDKHKDKLRLVQVGDGQHGWAFSWERWGGILEAVVREWPGDWLLHNANFDLAFFDREGIHIPRERVHDTMVMSRVNEPHMSMALKNQCARHVDAAAAGLQVEWGKATGWTWATVPIDYQPYWQYGALDPVLTYKLFEHHYPVVMREAPKAYELELSVQWVTERMSRYGTHVNRSLAAQKLQEFTDYCDRAESWCISEYGVKPGSNAAVIEVLKREGFDSAAYWGRQTKSGATSLDAEVLEGIDHPLANTVLLRRQLQKMASTYLRHYSEEADENDLLHPSINTLGAKTSRMSMSAPNLQNLPRHGTSRAGDVVRGMITTRYDGGSLLMCDFSQIEARLLAHVAKESGMIRAFTDEGDFFVNLAKQIFQDPEIKKNDTRRQVVKNATYAVLYGAGIQKFAQTAGITVDAARNFMRTWNTLFPGVRVFQDSTIAQAMSSVNSGGPRGVRSPLTNRWLIAEGGKEYSLVNFTIQCGAAEIFKMKLLECDAAGLGEWMFAPVHDEVLLDVPPEHVRDAAETLKKVMDDPDMLSVPITAEVSHGQSWGSKTSYTD